MMRPETALLQSGSGQNGLVVIEQNFDFDLLTPQKLLEKYVGRTIGVVKTHPTTGEETVEDAIVLSSNNGVVLRVGDRIETGLSGGRLIFPDVPENLRDKPRITSYNVCYTKLLRFHRLMLSKCRIRASCHLSRCLCIS